MIFFGSLSNVKSKGRAQVLLGKGSRKIWTCSCWEKSNFIMINEFKYGQTWKTWPSLVYHFIRMKGWVKEPPGFEHGSPGLGIQHLNHYRPLLHYTVKPLPLPFRKFAFGESPPASQQNTPTSAEGGGGLHTIYYSIMMGADFWTLIQIYL